MQCFMKYDLHLPVVEALISTAKNRKRRKWKTFTDIIYSDNRLCIQLYSAHTVSHRVAWLVEMTWARHKVTPVLSNLYDVTWFVLKKSKLIAGIDLRKRKIKSVHKKNWEMGGNFGLYNGTPFLEKFNQVTNFSIQSFLAWYKLI